MIAAGCVQNVAALLLAHRPNMPKIEASRVAEVVVQIMKSMNRAAEGKSAKEKLAMQNEFRLVLFSYLSKRNDYPKTK